MNKASLSSRPTRLLVVDSADFYRQNLAHHLASPRCLVSLAETSEQARTLLNKEIFDLALIDMDAPNVNAVSLTQRIHLERPLTKVIVVTSCGDDDLWVDFLTAGASDLLETPLRKLDLDRYLS
ncbi:hypothetical protein CVU37_09635 [candidate division BRC1 bacterium HGW-BRC1-1]|jgi:DNA-binding NtrC family response regulator|nr:MAG: hypothetical protein CVU37_09635 [candidate division BRC1 bacterium HGW-BRC1-1]